MSLPSNHHLSLVNYRHESNSYRLFFLLISEIDFYRPEALAMGRPRRCRRRPAPWRTAPKCKRRSATTRRASCTTKRRRPAAPAPAPASASLPSPPPSHRRRSAPGTIASSATTSGTARNFRNQVNWLKKQKNSPSLRVLTGQLAAWNY